MDGGLNLPMPEIRFECKVALPVMLIREDGMIVAYTPALNLGSCGRNQSEAVRRLGHAIRLFFTELVEMGTLDKALRELGWTKSENKRYTVPRLSEQPGRIQRNIPTHILARRRMNVLIPAAA